MISWVRCGNLAMDITGDSLTISLGVCDCSPVTTHAILVGATASPAGKGNSGTSDNESYFSLDWTVEINFLRVDKLKRGFSRTSVDGKATSIAVAVSADTGFG